MWEGGIRFKHFQKSSFHLNNYCSSQDWDSMLKTETRKEEVFQEYLEWAVLNHKAFVVFKSSSSSWEGFILFSKDLRGSFFFPSLHPYFFSSFYLCLVEKSKNTLPQSWDIFYSRNLLRTIVQETAAQIILWKWKSLSLRLCNPMDYTIHGIPQARILEWVAFPFSRGSSQPRDQTQISHTAGRFFTSWVTREAQEFWSG